MLTTSTKMQIEVWSDIMCPFCYIGKRNYENGLAEFQDRDDVEIVRKSFQLNPAIKSEDHKGKNVYQYLAEAKGMSYEQSVQMHAGVTQTAKSAGLEYHFDKSVITNSFNAHRVIQKAKTLGLGDQAEERLFYANFTEGLDYGERDVLVKLAKEIGMTEADVDDALTDNRYAELVEKDINEAREFGINGVPFFVFNRRYAVSGAQPPQAFTQALEKSYGEFKTEKTF